MGNIERIAEAIASDPAALRAMEDTDPQCSECGGTGRREGYARCPCHGSRGDHARCCGGAGVRDVVTDCEDCEGQGWRVKCGRCGTFRPPQMVTIDKTKPWLGSRLISCIEWCGCEED